MDRTIGQKKKRAVRGKYKIVKCTTSTFGILLQKQVYVSTPLELQAFFTLTRVNMVLITYCISRMNNNKIN